MKKILFTVTMCVMSILLYAQRAGDRAPEVDKSPMDMSYYPDNYPVLKIQQKATEPLVTRVIYSRPHLNGRSVFGELLQFDKVWRLGANEATEIEFYKDVVIGGKKVPKGRYTLYAIPNEKQWTIIVNKETETWGAFSYDEKKDVVRVNVPVQMDNEKAEAFSMTFEKTKTGCNMLLLWDKLKLSMPIAFK